MTRRILAVAGVAILGGTAVGALASPPRLTKSAFIRQADAICAETVERIDAMARPTTTAGALNQLDADVTLYGRLVREIGALRPPKSLEHDVTAMISAFARLRTSFAQARAAALAGNGQAAGTALRRANTFDTQARTLAYRLGLTACSGDFKPGTKVFGVPSSAMEPTLHCARPTPGCTAAVEDRVRTRALRQGEPKRFDILLFETPTGTANVCGYGGVFVQRLIGLPGETVSEKQGRIFVDGKPLSEPFVQAGRRGIVSGTWHIAKGRYFFMGDDRAVACDSRSFGSVPRKNLVGKVIEILRGSTTIPVG